jgi:thiol:disulfide interchange protein DsbD
MLQSVVPLIALAAGLSAPALAGRAGPPVHLVGDDVVKARLVLDSATVSAGSATQASLELTPAAGWHLYGPEHGDAGVPPDVTWTLPSSLLAGSIQFPRSTRVVTHGLTTFEYHGPVVLRVRLVSSPSAKPQRDLPIRADVTWVACSHVCAPGHTTLTATIDIVASRTPVSASVAPS